MNTNLRKLQCKNKQCFLNPQRKRGFSKARQSCRVNWQVQYYEIELKDSLSIGIEKFSFSLGLLFIMYPTPLIIPSVSTMRPVPFGRYCRMNLFPFSMTPFCHETHEPTEWTVVPGAFAIFLWHADPLPLSVVTVGTFFRQGRINLMAMNAFLADVRAFPCHTPT